MWTIDRPLVSSFSSMQSSRRRPVNGEQSTTDEDAGGLGACRSSCPQIRQVVCFPFSADCHPLYVNTDAFSNIPIVVRGHDRLPGRKGRRARTSGYGQGRAGHRPIAGGHAPACAALGPRPLRRFAQPPQPLTIPQTKETTKNPSRNSSRRDAQNLSRTVEPIVENVKRPGGCG